MGLTDADVSQLSGWLASFPPAASSVGNDSTSLPKNFLDADLSLSYFALDSLVSVLIVGLFYGAKNVLFYTRCMMQHFLAFRDSPSYHPIKTLA